MQSKQTRAALYARVSTKPQVCANQLHDLRTWAAYRGHVVVSEFVDEGISGAKGRDKRPALDAMLKAATRGELDVVAAWSLDRLGRDLRHLLELAATFKTLGVELYLHKESLDTSTPAGRMQFAMLGALAEFERERVRERVMAGLERARREGKRLGRPPVPASIQRRAERLLAQGASQRSVRRQLMLSSTTVRDIHRRMQTEGMLPA